VTAVSVPWPSITAGVLPFQGICEDEIVIW
jgi:hypothetical protein